MDISFDGLDWGTYYFFRFAAQHARRLERMMETGYAAGGYLIVTILVLAAVSLLLSAKRQRAALATLIFFLIGVALMEGTRLLISRSRPPDAENYVGATALTTGFPSRVLLVVFALLSLALALESSITKKSCLVLLYIVIALAITWVCVAELWLGISFVTDVIAGLAGGLALAATARLMAGETPAMAT
jgi:undecaprenyl-diphosphatase